MTDTKNGNGSVNGEPAVVQTGNTGREDRIDAYWGGKGSPDGPGHGHLVSNDGENANYIRWPGDSKAEVDDRD